MQWCHRCSVPPDSATFWIQHQWLFNPGSIPALVRAHVAFVGQVGSLPCDGGSPTRSLPASQSRRALCFQQSLVALSSVDVLAQVSFLCEVRES